MGLKYLIAKNIKGELNHRVHIGNFCLGFQISIFKLSDHFDLIEFPDKNFQILLNYVTILH